MKILYHHRIASKDGQYVHIEELITALTGLGHEIVMAEPGGISQQSFGSSSGPVQWLRSRLPGFLYEAVEFAYAFFDFGKLLLLLWRQRPAVIYERYNLFFPSGIWAKKLFGLPLILEVNAPLYAERHRHNGIQLKALAQWTEHYVWRQADHVLPVTHVLADMMIAAGVEPERMTVIPNGINRERFDSQADSAAIIERHHLAGKLVLGFTGFVRDWHRLDRVVQALAEHPREPWHLLLVGDGPAREALEAQAQALGVAEKVSITGVVARDEVAGYVSLFDIALQPDVVAYASPLKLFEYMMLGKAILAPDRANIREILTDGRDALLFEPENDASFFRQLYQLCANAQLRRQLGAAARATVDSKQLYWQENARKVVDLATRLAVF